VGNLQTALDTTFTLVTMITSIILIKVQRSNSGEQTRIFKLHIHFLTCLTTMLHVKFSHRYNNWTTAHF
jgi:hypothetical protein